jgi:muramoyltetrapeptide carboxypeptidase
MMHASPLAIITMRRELAARYATTTRQWLAARNTYRRLHDAPVKNIIALRDAAQRLDQLDRGRASLMRDLKALSDWSGPRLATQTLFHKSRALRPGDSVAVIAPAGPFDRESFDAGVAVIAERYRVQYNAPGIFQRHRYLAGDDQRRLAELTEFLADRSNRAIFCARGGYGTMRLLQKLPFHPGASSATAQAAASSAAADAARGQRNERSAAVGHPSDAATGQRDIRSGTAGDTNLAAARATTGRRNYGPAAPGQPVTEQPIIGFSDITALHQWRQAQGFVSIHGPVLTQLGRLGRSTSERLFSLLESEAPAQPLHGTTPFVEGIAEGPLLGGNLSVFTRLLGTPFMPDLEGAILLLEDVGERPYRLDRMWMHLELAGVFRKINGIALGSFTHCEERDATYSSQEVLRELAVATGLPCANGFPIGHGDVNEAVPLGVRVRLDATTAQLTFLESAVSEQW